METNDAYIEIVSKMNLKNVSENITNRFKDFCLKTSLHGFSYILNRDLIFFDRLLWAVAIIVQLVICYEYTRVIFERRSSHPILDAFETKYTLSYQVTICYEIIFERIFIEESGISFLLRQL